MKKTMLAVSAFALVLVLGASAFASTDDVSEVLGQKNLRIQKHLEMSKVFESGDFEAFKNENVEMAEYVDKVLFDKMTEMHKLRTEIRSELESKGFEGRGFGMGKGEGKKMMMNKKIKKGEGTGCPNFVAE